MSDPPLLSPLSSLLSLHPYSHTHTHHDTHSPDSFECFSFVLDYLSSQDNQILKSNLTSVINDILVPSSSIDCVICHHNWNLCPIGPGEERKAKEVEEEEVTEE
jgi:hypothetical protein